jgi:4a-hydroxytetrahydrobiopterin dehydratase
MPYAPLLTEAEIAASLPSIPGWRREAEELVRTFRCDTFRAAIALVSRVADAAEAADHHPDIQINWRRVTFGLTTKASRGLTAKDVAMAATIDRLGASVESNSA